MQEEKKENLKTGDGLADASHQLKQLAKLLRGQLEVKDRKQLQTIYKSCFIGSEAVSVLVKSGSVKTREEAVYLGNLMLAVDIFHHVTKEHNFKDEDLYYQFLCDKEAFEENEKKEDTSQNWKWSDKETIESIDNEKKDNLQTKLGDLSTEINPTKITQNETFGIWPMDAYNQQLLNYVHPNKWISPKPKSKYTLIVIGTNQDFSTIFFFSDFLFLNKRGGVGGLACASDAAAIGGDVAVIERHLLGGTHLNNGCVPSKALLKAAKVAWYAVHRAQEFGLAVEGKITVDFAKVMARMRSIRAKLAHHDACEHLAKINGLDLYLECAEFLSGTKIKVGEKVLNFARAVIATGAKPFIPLIPGIDNVEYLTSHTLWNLTELPKKLAIIGSGPGKKNTKKQANKKIEYFLFFPAPSTSSYIFFKKYCRKLKVIVLSRRNRILSREDKEASKVANTSLQSCGVHFELGVKYKSIDYVDPKQGKSSGIKIVVQMAAGKAYQEIVVSELLIATGRKPNIENLGLEKAMVRYDVHRGIAVNDYLQTSNSNIYAIGDCCTRFQYTHMAGAMAKIAIRNALLFEHAKCSDLLIPWCTYTFPEIAHVGLHESNLISRGVEYDIIKVNLSENDRSICQNETQGFVKVLIKKGADQIFGCTIVAENAGDIINEITLAIQTNTGLGYFAGVVHPYPTVAEGIKAAGDAYNRTRLTFVAKIFLRRILSARR
ncbi:hypothetical protein RFI_08957 [Reticulomyxa filosa]|uniref:DEP domain-containing protein n=1 Tax=Reticulomyxa filosa TaxID=46433 RepID=X6NR29_RETFI|nr:hypothetical protein RFI_08957 [Reticulomyxa filosa]|eukprot:ETO28179.1 hypothetical protein RFI_08957 [Reticulomyxa filosa]